MAQPDRGRRAPAGPGRGKPRTRVGGRISEPVSAPQPSQQPVLSAVSRASKGAGLTGRALSVIALVAILALSYATSMKVYFTQQHDLAVARQQVAQHTAKIGELQAEFKRWNDPDFVRAQARERLGWIMPGETGYQVMSDDGKLMGGGATLTGPVNNGSMWWDRMWGSVRVADDPGRKP